MNNVLLDSVLNLYSNDMLPIVLNSASNMLNDVLNEYCARLAHRLCVHEAFNDVLAVSQRCSCTTRVPSKRPT